MNTSSKNIILGLAVVGIILVSLFMLTRSDRRIVLSISGFQTPTEKVTIGGGASGICYTDVPENYMEVEYKDGAFRWTVNPTYVKKDSLYYYKVNGKNPNLHLLGKEDEMKVDVGDKEPMRLGLKDVKEVLKGVTSKYVLLRNVLEKIRNNENDAEKGRLSNQKRLKDHRELKSFLWRETKRGDWHLVILDRKTTLVQGGEEHVYVDAGTTLNYPPANALKIQFFHVADYSYQTEKVDDESVEIDGVNYQMKPVQMMTEWTSGHVLIRQAEGGGLDVSFPKPITYVESVDTLRKLVDNSFNVLSIVQQDGSFPISKNLYVPPFSSTITQYLCNLYVDTDSIVLRNGSQQQRIESRWRVLPSLQRIDLNTAEKGKIRMSVGMIDGKFALSYLCFPFLIFLMIFFAYPLLVDVRGNRERGKVSDKARLLPQHFRLMALIAFAYCVCKVLIAMKLSFSFPYFEKLTGVVSVATGLMLMLMFTLSLVMNRDFLTIHVVKERRNQNLLLNARKWVAVGVSVLGVVICWLGMRSMDNGFSSELLKAYLPSDLFSWNVLKWTELSGMNDLHRSVVYSLLFMNVLAIVVLILSCFTDFANICSERIEGWHDALVRKVDSWKWMQTGLKEVERLGGSRSRRETLGAKLFFLLLLRYILCYVMIPALVVLLMAWLIPGNFATALISLGLVIGLSWALSHVSWEEGFGLAFTEMLSALVIIMLCALVADMGYYTNVFGLLVGVILFYFLTQKEDFTPQNKKRRERERVVVRVIMVGAVLFMLLFPKLLNVVFDVENVTYNRGNRRFMMYSQFEKYRNSGYRYAVSDTEFMTVMGHYMYQTNGRDPLSNEHHYLHPSISSGQSPVVLNDVSIQAAFFGTYGWLAYVVFFGLLVVIAWVVLSYSIDYNYEKCLHRQMRWRVLAVLMWVGTSVYLYLSYIGMVPFTGRLNPGFGVDSVGEMLENAILLAFMTATALRNEK